MTYIITTKQRGGHVGLLAPEAHGHKVVSRVAVATLDEGGGPTDVRGYCHILIDRIEGPEYDRAAAQIDALTEQGGTVGPLPDGTVIEVEGR